MEDPKMMKYMKHKGSEEESLDDDEISPEEAVS